MTVREANEAPQALPRRYRQPSLVRGPVLAQVTAQKVSGVPSDT